MEDYTEMDAERDREDREDREIERMDRDWKGDL